jgi:polysaccharide export outer membrane protein
MELLGMTGVTIDPLLGRRHNGGMQARRGRARQQLRFTAGDLGRRLGFLLALAPLLAAATQPAHTADYEIGPGDVLKVVVLGQADMTGSFAVDPEGMMSFPILGKIKASENTTLELERKLTILLADGILKRPQVTVMVAEYGSQKVFVTGEVQRPGQYALKADRTLLALLGDVGPLGPNSGHEVIVVRPPAGSATASGPAVPLSLTEEPGAPPAGAPTPETPPTTTTAEPAAPASGIPGLPFVAPGSEVFRISLLELQSGNPEKNIPLKAGDTVYFPRAAQVYVMGSVARPGPYRYQEGMTVLQALTLAGGATARGSAGRTKVVRIVNGRKVEKKAKATDLVQPEDTLLVPERFF